MSSERIAIAMGGSGARCAEALTYLCAAGLGPQDLSMVIADADTQNYNVVRTVEVLGLYAKLQGDPNHRSASPLFRTTLALPAEPGWSPFPRTSNISLEEHFGYSSMAMAQTPATKTGARLMEALYTRDQRVAKLNIGFRGKPSLGAAICADTLDITQRPWNEIVNTLAVNSARQQQSWVLGMGSVFGGMGAAGLPVLPSLLKQSVPAGRDHVRLGDLLLLPYFTFPPPPPNSPETVHAASELFALNSREALRYYSDQNAGFNDFYVLGVKDAASQRTFALGAKEQANLPHFVELLGAIGALRFYNSGKGQNEGVHLLAVENMAKFGWGDVPDAARVQPALNNLARACSFYLCAVFPVLDRIHRKDQESSSSSLRTPWYRDFVEKRGLQPFETANWEWFQAMQLFSVRYLGWLRDLQRNMGAIALDLVEIHGLNDISDDHRALSVEQFSGDQLKQGIHFRLGTAWREFCHLCAGNSHRDLPPERAFEKKLFAATSFGG